MSVRLGRVIICKPLRWGVGLHVGSCFPRSESPDLGHPAIEGGFRCGPPADKGFEVKKIRGLHFDLPLALTARTHGARLITSNRDDFELICGYMEFRMDVWKAHAWL